MLIAIAAVAATLVAVEPPKTVVRIEGVDVIGACAAGIINTDNPAVRFDRDAPDAGGIDRQPDRSAPLLFSAVERKVDGCSLPVVRVRVRATDRPATPPQAVPLDR